LTQLKRLAEMGIQAAFGQVARAESITAVKLMGREIIPAAAEF
jgi:hypothetical protein